MGNRKLGTIYSVDIQGEPYNGVAETTVTNQSTPLGSKIVQDTAATNSAVDNTTGASLAHLYLVEIDNTGYATNIYLKMGERNLRNCWYNCGHMVLYCPSSKRSYVFPEGIAVFSRL